MNVFWSAGVIVPVYSVNETQTTRRAPDKWDIVILWSEWICGILDQGFNRIVRILI